MFVLNKNFIKKFYSIFFFSLHENSHDTDNHVCYDVEIYLSVETFECMNKYLNIGYATNHEPLAYQNILRISKYSHKMASISGLFVLQTMNDFGVKALPLHLTFWQFYDYRLCPLFICHKLSDYNFSKHNPSNGSIVVIG